MTPPQIPDNSSRQADLEHVLAILRRRAGLILLCFVVTGGAAFGFSSLQQKQYSVSALLLFGTPGFAADLFGAAAAGSSASPTYGAATNVKLVGLNVIAERTARRLKRLSTAEVAGMVTVSSEGEAEIVSVTATSPDPARAELVANTFARQFIASRARSDKSRLLQAKRLAELEFSRLTHAQQRGVRGESLSRGAEKLGILASLQTGNAELVQPAGLPTSPISPKPLRDGILGAVVGLLLGIGLAFLFERLNRQLRSPEEAREAFGWPMLGTVPESKAIMASNDGSEAVAELPFMENEAFRTMRASLRYFNVDHDLRSVLVTSYTANVGKSTVAWNLARVAASSAKVVVVEADMRNPRLARQHGLKSGPGLAELLTHQVELDEAIQARRFAVGANGKGSAERGLDAIVAGANPPNHAELIESEAMTEVLAQLRERYELVVIDTAPTGVVSDAFPLLHKVDGVIVVARIGETTRDAAERLREQLDRLEAPVLGVVANAVKLNRRRRYGYGYYGYYGSGYGPGPAEQPSGAQTDAESPR